jgi:SAM-dependent methyltransferase
VDAVGRTRAFFAPRAAAWDVRFPDDAHAFAAAVAALGPEPGARVLDVGCGTARAGEALRRAVGPSGLVFALDATPEMLVAARAAGRAAIASLVLGDALRLPVRADAFDAVFAAGLLTHFDDPRAGLRAFASVTRRDGRLALFHPIGRAALAARHGHGLEADDVRAPAILDRACAASGWALLDVDDGADRYLAIARRAA